MYGTKEHSMLVIEERIKLAKSLTRRHSKYVHKGIREGKYRIGSIGMMCWFVPMSKKDRDWEVKKSLRNDYVTCPMCKEIMKGNIMEIRKYGKQRNKK